MAETQSRSGPKPSLAAYCSASRGVSVSTFIAASRIASTGKVSADGRPPASERTPGSSVSLRISRMTEGFMRSQRWARCQGEFVELEEEVEPVIAGPSGKKRETEIRRAGAARRSTCDDR